MMDDLWPAEVMKTSAGRSFLCIGNSKRYPLKRDRFGGYLFIAYLEMRPRMSAEIGGRTVAS